MCNKGKKIYTYKTKIGEAKDLLPIFTFTSTKFMFRFRQPQ